MVGLKSAHVLMHEQWRCRVTNTTRSSGPSELAQQEGTKPILFRLIAGACYSLGLACPSMLQASL